MIAAHPLQGEVARLRTVEERLRRVEQAFPQPTVPRVTLPAFPASDAPVSPQIAAQIEQARTAARDRFTDEVRQEIAAYEANKASRDAELENQVRAEKIAELAARDAAEDRSKRAAIDRATIEAINALTTDKVVLQARYEVLRAQLGSDSVFLPPLTDPPGLERDVRLLSLLVLARGFPQALVSGWTGEPFDLLSVNPYLEGVGARPRLELRRRFVVEKLETLDSWIQTRIAQSEREKQQLARETDEQRREEVNRILAELRKQQDDNAVENAIEAAERILAEEERIATQAVTDEDRGTGAVQIRTPVPAGLAKAGSTQEAALQVARQRERLERWIAASVSDTAQDIAKTLNVDLALAQTPEEAERLRARGREDKTQQFVRWIATGAIRPNALEGSL
ncbi:MAG: hypothetical protein OHK0029_02290 [Armatimonadaceae bacterium]